MHFFHRVVAILLVVVVVTLAINAMRVLGPSLARRLAMTALGVVLVQMTLGVLSVTTSLSVPVVSLHTLGAAVLLAALIGFTTLTWEPGAVLPTNGPQRSESPPQQQRV